MSSVGFTYDGTFDQALNAGGGGATALARHAASAYLNAIMFGEAAYGMSAADVVADFNAAILAGGAAIGAQADIFADLEDVDGRICDAGTPNTNAGGKGKNK